MPGSLLSIDGNGQDGEPLQHKWYAGPRTYLGLATAGFPNLSVVTGPGSSTVLSNMLLSIEQHVEWISDCVAHLRAGGMTSIEATQEAEDSWVAHVAQIAEYTVHGAANTWYNGANIPGKPRVYMPYTAGVGAYRKI